MAKQHYFMFSDGSYSDYCVGGLYVCDHGVTEVEWEEYLKTYRELSTEQRYSAMRQYSARRGKNDHWEYVGTDGKIHVSMRDGISYQKSEEAMLYRKWREANDPQESFIKVHNMVKVEYTELHGGN